MPFAIAGLATVALALATYGLCVTAVYLLRAIAAVMPKITLGFFTIDFGAIFTKIVQPAVRFFVAAGEAVLKPAEQLIHAVAYLAVGIFGDVKGVLSNIYTHVDHIFSSVIPETAAHAQAQANTYTKQETAYINAQVAAARAEIGTSVTRAQAQGWLKDEALVKSTKAALLAIVAQDILHAEHYTDTQIKSLRDSLTGKIGAIHPTDVTDVTNVTDVAAPAGPLVTTDDFTGLATKVTAIAGTVAGIGTAVASLATEFERCAVTACEGPNNLQGLLTGILGLTGLAEFGIFLSDVINNPAAAEAQYASTFSGLASGLISGGGSIWNDLESVLSL